MSNTLTYRDCPYCWKSEEDKYPCCQFKKLAEWDTAPCEYEDGQDDDDYPEYV